MVMVKDMEISWDIMGYRNTPLNMDIMGCKYTTVFVFTLTLKQGWKNTHNICNFGE
jgi:hypothetical protein